MRYQKFRPDNELSQYVECYFNWEGTTVASLDFESPPSALCALVFNCGDTYEISNYKYERSPVPKFFIGGQAIKNYTLHLNGKIAMVGAVLRPTALYNLFDIPMYGFTGERIAFQDVDKEEGSILEQNVQNAGTAEKRMALIEDYFLKKFRSQVFASREITAAANEIYDRKGQLNIMELIAAAPMSRRTFERKFLNEVGVSPKTYAKIRRFGNTCLLMAGKRNVNLMDLLHEGGYYDQSHFIKDFKYFSGRTPKIYAETNVELANYVDQVSIVERRLEDDI